MKCKEFEYVGDGCLLPEKCKYKSLHILKAHPVYLTDGCSRKECKECDNINESRVKEKIIKN